jgi:hypothetical protein
MGQDEDDMAMITGEQPHLLNGQPALSLEVRTWRTGPLPTRVVPDARHMAVRTGWDMAAKRGTRAAPQRGSSPNTRLPATGQSVRSCLGLPLPPLAPFARFPYGSYDPIAQAFEAFGDVGNFGLFF